jgi:hypothetical protein
MLPVSYSTNSYIITSGKSSCAALRAHYVLPFTLTSTRGACCVRSITRTYSLRYYCFPIHCVSAVCTFLYIHTYSTLAWGTGL